MLRPAEVDGPRVTGWRPSRAPSTSSWGRPRPCRRIVRPCRPKDL